MIAVEDTQCRQECARTLAALLRVYTSRRADRRRRGVAEHTHVLSANVHAQRQQHFAVVDLEQPNTTWTMCTHSMTSEWNGVKDWGWSRAGFVPHPMSSNLPCMILHLDCTFVHGQRVQCGTVRVRLLS